MIKKILGIVLLFAALICLGSCREKADDITAASTSTQITASVSASAKPQIPSATAPRTTEVTTVPAIVAHTPVYPSKSQAAPAYSLPALMGEYFTQMPIVSAALRAKGISGGEGGQWELAVACDPVEGSLLFCGTDVGGIYRSVDGGQTWQPSNSGLHSRGCCDFAIDPNNINNVLAIGANSGYDASNGIYLSTDRGGTWTQVFPASICGYRDFRDQIAFDPSSYDAAGCGSMIAYWSPGVDKDDYQAWGSRDVLPYLYKSVDGGKTWKVVNSTIGWDSIVKVNPANGYVYIANDSGFYVSTNEGADFTKTMDGAVNGLDVILPEPDNVYITTADGLFISTDSGETFTEAAGGNFPAGAANNPVNLKVSPADPSRMILCNMIENYNNTDYYTDDGGATWKKSNIDNSDAMLPYNNREHVFAWNPANASDVWSFGGDWVTESTDGGKTFKWNCNGNTGIMTGGMFNFSVNDPNVLYFGSQDYNGYVTKDAGSTWSLVNFSGNGWGGFCYGGYAVDASTMFTLNSDGGWDSPREIRISFDGGKTCVDTGVMVSGLDVSYSDPVEKNVFFASDYRSADGGKTWIHMSDCGGVFTHNTKTDDLYGADGDEVVVSSDHGATWTPLVSLGNNVSDIACDPVNGIIYAAASDNLYKYEISTGTLTDLTDNIPQNYCGTRKIGTVAVDPVYTGVIYCGGCGNTYMNDDAVMRSLDGGASWQVLTENGATGIVTCGPDAGREAGCIRVNPVTRTVYIAGECFGYATFPAVYADG